MLNALDPVALEPALRQEKARRSLLDFARLMYPRFDSPPHLRLIADLLERLERREMRKLQISVPVRHGKSVLASQLYIAWLIGRNPEAQIVLASHSEELAIRNSRIARHLLEDDRWPFPNVKLASDSSAAGRWNTKQGGGVYAVGVGGSITGRGATDLCIDDAVHDGLSQAERDKAYRWYSEIMASRVEPGGASILIGARFAEDDLCGKILDSEDGRNWRVVNLAAIAGDNDILKREPGEALWPQRFPIKELEERRIEMGSRAFEAQFQQRPIPLAGGLFSASWLENRYDGGVPFITTTVKSSSPFGTVDSYECKADVFLSIDTAMKEGPTNDFSALVVVASDGRQFYVIDCVRERLEFPRLIKRVEDVAERWKPKLIWIEDASSGTPLVQVLKQNTRLPVVAVKVLGSKQSRAEAVSPIFEQQRVWLPRNAPWLDTYIKEFLAFGPDCLHDDMVDASVMAIERIIDQANRKARIVQTQKWRKWRDI